MGAQHNDSTISDPICASLLLSLSVLISDVYNCAIFKGRIRTVVSDGLIVFPFHLLETLFDICLWVVRMKGQLRQFRTLKCFAPFCEEKIGFAIPTDVRYPTDCPWGVAAIVLYLSWSRESSPIYFSVIWHFTVNVIWKRIRGMYCSRILSIRMPSTDCVWLRLYARSRRCSTSWLTFGSIFQAWCIAVKFPVLRLHFLQMTEWVVRTRTLICHQSSAWVAIQAPFTSYAVLLNQPFVYCCLFLFP